jgi:hypothetical protein
VIKSMASIAVGAIIAVGGVIGQAAANSAEPTPPAFTPTHTRVTPQEYVVPVDWCQQEDDCYPDFRRMPDGSGRWVIVQDLDH